MKKPQIILEFEADGTVTWASVGWGKNKKLMVAAKAAINKGENPEEVLSLLKAAGFETEHRFHEMTEQEFNDFCSRA